MKIKIRLIILFLLISVVPLAILSGFAVNTARHSLKSTIGKDIEDLAREKARAMALIIKERINEATILSETHDLKDAVKEKNLSYAGKTDAEVLKAILDIDKEWIDAKGKTDTANGILNSDLSMFLNKYQAKDKERYGEIFVTDLKGATVGATEILSDYYQADEGWWESSLDGGKGKIFIDDRGFDESIGAIAMGVVVPVRDNGDVIGILKINYKVRSIIDIVVATGAKESGIRGKLSNSMERVLAQTEVAKYGELSDKERAILHKKEDGWIEDVHGGVKTLMGYSPVDVEIHTRVPNPGEIKGITGEKWEPTTWFIFIDIEQEKGFAPIDKLVKFIFIFGILISVFVVVLALYFAKTISDPILKLTKGTETIGTGDLNYKVGTDAKDEIGALSRSFDTMTDRLKTTTASRDELRQSQTLLATTLDSLLEAVFIVDAETVRIKNCNRAVLDVFGYSREEIIGQTVEHLHVNKKALMDFRKHRDKEVEEKGLLDNFEFSMKHKDGTIFPTEHSAIPILNEENKRKEWVSVVRDITERKRTEEALKESEHHFRSIFNNSAIGISLLNKDWEWVDCNPELCKMLGYTNEELRGKTPAIVSDPEYVDENVKFFEELKEGKRDSYEMEKRYIRKDGTPFWGRLNVSLFKSKIDTSHYIIGMLEDITERKRAEEALLESEELLTKTLNSLLDAVLIVDAKSITIKECNPAAEKIFGYSREELIGRSTSLLHVNEETLADFRKQLYKEVEEKGWLDNFEFSMKRKDGTIISTEHSVIPILDEKRKRKEWVSVVRDITDRKRAEEEIITAKKAAEKANMLKTQFIATTNHELRGPLHTIIGYLKLVLENKFDNRKEETDFLNNAYISSIHLKGLISDLLDISAIESDKIRMTFKSVSLMAVFTHVRAITSMHAKEKKLKLDINCLCHESAQEVYCDPERLKQALVNLIGNAIKFTEKGSVSVYCEPGSEKGTVKINVKDTGIGIDPGGPDVFEPFVQMYGSKFGGTGLGLSIAKKLVEKMNGTLEVSSGGIGKGTTVSITLPELPANSDL